MWCIRPSISGCKRTAYHINCCVCMVYAYVSDFFLSEKKRYALEGVLFGISFLYFLICLTTHSMTPERTFNN